MQTGKNIRGTWHERKKGGQSVRTDCWSYVSVVWRIHGIWRIRKESFLQRLGAFRGKGFRGHGTCFGHDLASDHRGKFYLVSDRIYLKWQNLTDDAPKGIGGMRRFSASLF